MHEGPRPVKGGAARTGVKNRPLTNPHGGSRGPGDPWSAAAASKRWGEALERLCREIAQRCADGRSASEPVPLFPAAVQAANAKGLGLCLTSTRSRKNNDESRRCKKEGHQPNPATNLQGKPCQKPIKEKNQRARHGRVRVSPQSNRPPDRPARANTKSAFHQSIRLPF